MVKEITDDGLFLPLNMLFKGESMNEKSFFDKEFPELALDIIGNAHIGTRSQKKVSVKCPCCGYIFERRVADISKSGTTKCPACRDGFSYPEKLMMNILRSLNVDYKHHFTSYWTENFIYDFMFIIDNIKYIVEMDGDMGHGKNNSISGVSGQESLEIDNIKDNLARNNDFKIVRICCRYKRDDRFLYIKKNIESSILGNLFDLSTLDWTNIHSKSCDSIYHSVIKEYLSGNKYVNDIARVVSIKPRTIIKYLTEAMSSGLIGKETIWKKDPDTIVRKYKTEKLYLYEKNMMFDSINEAANYFGCSRSKIYYSLTKRNGVIDDMHLFRDDEHINKEDISVKPIMDKIYQYDKNWNLINSYTHWKDIPSDYYRANIYRAITGERKSAYGFYWTNEDRKENIA